MFLTLNFFLLVYSFLIFPVFGQEVNSFCDKNDNVSVNYHIDYGVPVYKYVSVFPGERKNTDGYKIKGLTDIKYKRSYDIKVDLYNSYNKACLKVSKIDVYFGFPNIDVLIYEKYPIGSCEYSVIKNHENKHIKIYQNILKYYSEDIGRTIYSRIKNKKPILIYDVDNLKKNTEKYIIEVKDFIISDENLNKIEEKMMQEIEYENGILDTKENYDKTKNLCKNW